MNAFGTGVSKGKSMVAVMHPCGEVVLAPFEVSHTGSDLSELAKALKKLPGETRVVMEYTGYYHAPVALALCEADLYVSVFLVMSVLLQKAPQDQPVYQFMDKKRSQGKPYKVYMMAAANKFLRIYYAKVKAHLDALEKG